MAIRLNDGYRIVVSAGCSASGAYAAAELARYLEQITGGSFPVVKDDVPGQDCEILIGKTSRPGTPSGAGLKNDGYVLRTAGKKLFICGENDRANLYGVYYLLEKYLGCGFYAHDVERVPVNEEACLPEIDEMRISPLEYRETYWYEPYRYEEFAIKRGFNGSWLKPYGSKVGGCVRVDALAHTMFQYVHPDEYFDEHPEYFSMVDGKRIRISTQLCLTNPDVLEITKRKLRQKIRENPDIRIFGISQMDWLNPCQCPACAKIDAEEGSHMGTMLRFLNALAEDIERDYPDVVIETLAYQYTRQVPKITRPHPNVLICFCTIENCFTHPLRRCTKVSPSLWQYFIPGTSVKQDLQEWGRICKRMFIWDYTTNYSFYLAPMINFHVLQDNINFFLENGATALFEQGNAESVSGEFGELRAYILSKLMWEPHGDVSAWMDEFLAGYYGEAAAKPIRAYIDYLADFVERFDIHAGIYDSPKNVIPKAVFPVLDQFWDAAEAAAANGEQLTRIRRSRLQLRFVKLLCKRHTDMDYQETADRFLDDVKKHGITHLREGRSFEEGAAQIGIGCPPVG